MAQIAQRPVTRPHFMACTTKKNSTGNISPDEYSRGTVCHLSLGLKFCAFPKLTASLRSSQNEEALKMLAVGDFHSKTLQVLRRRDKGHKWFWHIDISDVTLYAPDHGETTPKVAVLVQMTHNGLAFMSHYSHLNLGHSVGIKARHFPCDHRLHPCYQNIL